MDAYSARDSLGNPVASSSQDDGEILRLFETEHLPAHLREVSAPFREVAVTMLEMVPVSARGEQFRFGVQHLLVAKNAFVQNAL